MKKNKTLGGRARQLKKDGFTFDMSVIIEFFDKNQEISSLVIFENENNQLEELVLNDFY